MVSGADSILDVLEENRDEIRSFGVESLELIGSYARDEASEDSDIDFLVVFGEDRGGYDDFTGLKDLLEDLLGRDVDLVKPKYVRPELASSILEGERVESKI